MVQEILAGAVSEEWRREIDRDLVQPFERRRRVIVPGYREWMRSGEITATLVERGELSRAPHRPSFMNDVLLATSCREKGITLVTRNTRDFERIGRVEKLRFVPPWPAA